MEVKLVISRFHPAKDAAPREQTFTVEVDETKTVLDALLETRSQDPTVSFRKSCRSTICGSCAMTINGEPALACHKRVLDVLEPGESTVRLSPLVGFRLIKDLVVDIDPLFESLDAIVPWLLTRPDHDGLVPPDQAAKVEGPALCILCGACDSLVESGGGVSPAAIVKNWRFALDVRDRLGEERFKLLDVPEQTLALFARELKKVCPKEIEGPNAGKSDVTHG